MIIKPHNKQVTLGDIAIKNKSAQVFNGNQRRVMLFTLRTLGSHINTLELMMIDLSTSNRLTPEEALKINHLINESKRMVKNSIWEFTGSDLNIENLKEENEKK